MELTLKRTYDKKGTNGVLTYARGAICFTIELPNLANKPQVSCIPEGRYKLTKRHSEKHGLHLLVNDVPGRSEILMHEANWAVKQLRGCIAPVTTLDGPGVGWKSGAACDRLESIVFPILDAGGAVFLNIVG